MKNTRHRWIVVGLLVVLVLVAHTSAWGAAVSTTATGTGSGFYLEDLGVKIFSMCKNVIIPLLLIGIVIFTGGNVAFGWVQMGQGLSRFLMGAAIIAGGIEAVLLLVAPSTSGLLLP